MREDHLKKMLEEEDQRLQEKKNIDLNELD